MKRIILGIILMLSFTSLAGCTFWTNDENKSTFFDGTLSESIRFEEDVTGFDQVKLSLDLSVSSVTVESIKGKKLIYEQKSNRKELLADVNKNTSGNALDLHFKNDQRLKITTGTQNSEVTIRIPEGLTLIYESNVGVGDMEIALDDLKVNDLNVKLNVGKIHVFSKQDQNTLEKIILNTDVGDIKTDLNGAFDVLKEVYAKSNTGSVKLLLEGSYANTISISGQSDVGEVHIDLPGSFKKPVTCKVNSSVGDVMVRLPKNHEIVIDAKTTEFTSNLELKDLKYSKNKERYTVTGDKSKISVDLSITIGKAVVAYSN